MKNAGGVETGVNEGASARGDGARFAVGVLYVVARVNFIGTHGGERERLAFGSSRQPFLISK